SDLDLQRAPGPRALGAAQQAGASTGAADVLHEPPALIPPGFSPPLTLHRPLATRVGIHRRLALFKRCTDDQPRKACRALFPSENEPPEHLGLRRDGQPDRRGRTNAWDMRPGTAGKKTGNEAPAHPGWSG